MRPCRRNEHAMRTVWACAALAHSSVHTSCVTIRMPSHGSQLTNQSFFLCSPACSRHATPCIPAGQHSTACHHGAGDRGGAVRNHSKVCACVRLGCARCIRCRGTICNHSSCVCRAQLACVMNLIMIDSSADWQLKDGLASLMPGPCSAWLSLALCACLGCVGCSVACTTMGALEHDA